MHKDLLFDVKKLVWRLALSMFFLGRAVMKLFLLLLYYLLNFDGSSLTFEKIYACQFYSLNLSIIFLFFALFDQCSYLTLQNLTALFLFL